MKILHTYPPNYAAIDALWGVHRNPNVVFTYGDTLYVPGNGQPNEALLAHEEVHAEQQGNDPDNWWDRYMTDETFRLAQELEAYQAQYRYMMDHYARPQRRQELRRISNDLASSMYGGIITKEEAKDLIASDNPLVLK